LAGEQLSFDYLTDDDLYILYVKENCLNREIAELFEVKLEKVSK
jgi:hypothetical protein